jgi:hypothetical protein
MNSTHNILAAILVNVSLTAECQDLGDWDRVAQLCAVYDGLQAAFAFACKAEGITKRVACRRFAKPARMAALKAGAPRKWLPTVPQIAA